MRHERPRAALAAVLVALIAAPVGSAAAAPWDKSGIDWSKAPPLGPEPTFKPPRPTSYKLKSGATLLVVENHRLPLVTVRVVVKDAGANQDPAGKSGLAAFTADLLDEGAGGLGPLQISEEIDRLGADLSIYVTQDAARLSLDTLSRTFDESMGLLVKILTAPAFDEGEAKRVFDDRVTNVRLRPDRPREVAALILRGVLYGTKAAYGRPTDGFLGELEKLAVADARAFYAARFTPKAVTFVVVGDVDGKALAATLDARLAGWKPKGGKAAPVKAAAAKSKARFYLIDRPGAEQADVQIGLFGTTMKDKRTPAIDVLANILGGTFTSRLNRRLREELGWTYGIRASAVRYLAGGHFVISSALVTPHAVEGVAEVLKIVGSMVDGDVPDEELAKAKANIVRELPQFFATNGDVAGVFAELVETGMPLGYYDGYAARIGKVTLKEVRAAAKALVPAGKLIVVVAGDAAVIKEGLEKQLGPAELRAAELAP